MEFLGTLFSIQNGSILPAYFLVVAEMSQGSTFQAGDIHIQAGQKGQYTIPKQFGEVLRQVVGGEYRFKIGVTAYSDSALTSAIKSFGINTGPSGYLVCGAPTQEHSPGGFHEAISINLNINPTGPVHGDVLVHQGDFSSDGRKTVYPIHNEQDNSDGSATVDIDETGTFSLTINGHHSGETGQTDFTAAVVVTGFKNGSAHTVLNQPSSRNLTVTASFPSGSNSKSATFTDLPAIAPADIDHVRNVRVLLASNKSGQNFVDVISSAIGAASTLLQEANALYKQWNDSDLGQSVNTAAAAD
jgi:hypothetical protein